MNIVNRLFIIGSEGKCLSVCSISINQSDVDKLTSEAFFEKEVSLGLRHDAGLKSMEICHDEKREKQSLINRRKLSLSNYQNKLVLINQLSNSCWPASQ